MSGPMMADELTMTEELTRKQAMMAGIPYIVTKQFPWKLHEMLETVEKNGEDSIVSWLPNGLAFKVHRPSDFAEKVMKTHFNGQSKYKSFQRQLNLWGFERHPNHSPEIDFRGSYYHPLFIRGRKDLCSEMARQKIKGTGCRRRPSSSHEKSNDYYASRPASSSSLVLSSSPTLKSLLPVPPPETTMIATTVSTSDDNEETSSTSAASVSFKSLLDGSLLVPRHHFDNTSDSSGGGAGSDSSSADAAAAFIDPVFSSTNGDFLKVDALEAASMFLGQRRQITTPTLQAQTQTSSSNSTTAPTPTAYTDNSILDLLMTTQDCFSQLGGAGAGAGATAFLAAAQSTGTTSASDASAAALSKAASQQANKLLNFIAAMPSATSQQQHYQLDNSLCVAAAMGTAYGNATASPAPALLDWLGSSLAQADAEIMDALRRRAALETLLKPSSSRSLYHQHPQPQDHPFSAAPPAPSAADSKHSSLLTAAHSFQSLTRNSF